MTLAAEEIDDLFRALADPTRRDILRRCVGAEPSVSQLAQAYPMSFAAVQKHVAVLERAGLVTKARRGREQSCAPMPTRSVARVGPSTSSGPLGAGEWSGWRISFNDERKWMSVTSVDTDYDNLTITLIVGRDGGTRMEMQSAFESREDMEKVVSIGTVEGLQQAGSQMDGVLDS